MDHSPSVSFIGIVDFTEDAKWLYCSASVHDLLGFEPRELIGRPSLELVHPDEFAQVRGIHYSTITQDQAAVLAYLRMRHKDPCKGYVLCAISRTVCQNVLVGSVSYATPGPKAMHNASTAQEVTIITPTAKDFEFRSWTDAGLWFPSVSFSTSPLAPSSATVLTNNPVGIVDFTEDAKWLYCSASVHDLLGFEPRELIGRPSLELVHPDEFAQDQAAVLAYLRMRHKDPCKGYVLCAISRTVCQNVLVGSVSYATPGPKAMHNASTAQEVTIITPTAKDFEFRRWNDPSPMPPSPVPAHLLPHRTGSPPSLPHNTYPEHFDPLPEQSVRTALILDRFTVRCTVSYCSNDSLLRTTDVLGRPFWDFVAPRDERLVRSWIDVIKGWGVNERGQPSDGGFGYGKFALFVTGRDSSARTTDVSPALRHRSRPQRTHGHTLRPTDVPPPASSSRARAGNDFLRELTRERPPTPGTGTGTGTGTSTTGGGGGGGGYAQPPSLWRGQADELAVDAIFSAHSDGLMVILRRSSSAGSSGGSGSSSGSGTSASSSLGALSPPPPPQSFADAGQGGHGAASYTFPPPPPPPLLARRRGSSGSGSGSGAGGQHRSRSSYPSR
ncbi:uncharacterized protein PHACADRAFT_187070 [Phanerochaete carnosa HHB-10118-sp]|uniref:PAS domain-containing protein n=1 Tax=Phanerochaete carnosa (strain HHB-10118-sp) TaxID=650164 RepID=K5VXS9_PHACS|nr:uncharacterized protein PHACADRAFT_187070 [Phanerochaete carnosa HHB-10118-sp]EKM51635.1 hypothetical protein PHACADRAFT_187070 [Phanerochaete carnosa HHB-10118-sp]